MPEYRRPTLLTADLVEVSEHLLAKGIKARITYDATAMLITIDGTSAELTSALADYVPIAAMGQYRYPLPAGIAAHTQHLLDFRTAVRGGTQSAKTTAVRVGELEHVTADIIDGLRLLIDDRLG